MAVTIAGFAMVLSGSTLIVFNRQIARFCDCENSRLISRIMIAIGIILIILGASMWMKDRPFYG
ncbi:MAG: hypothetical protein ABJB40_06360 [Acidobacteriota bacterium]